MKYCLCMQTFSVSSQKYTHVELQTFANDCYGYVVIVQNIKEEALKKASSFILK